MSELAVKPWFSADFSWVNHSHAPARIQEVLGDPSEVIRGGCHDDGPRSDALAKRMGGAAIICKNIVIKESTNEHFDIFLDMFT